MIAHVINKSDGEVVEIFDQVVSIENGTIQFSNGSGQVSYDLEEYDVIEGELVDEPIRISVVGIGKVEGELNYNKNNNIGYIGDKVEIPLDVIKSSKEKVEL